jgi:uncharacterized membrane-anchored protein
MSGRFRRATIIAAVVAFILLPATVNAQQPVLPDLASLTAKFKSIPWQHGPCKALVRNITQVEVPAGYKFTGEAGTATMMELTQNLPRPSDLGLLCPSSWEFGRPHAGEWFLVYEWDSVGYVKDDEKNLDANAILEALRKGQEQANVTLKSKGLPELTLAGWEQAPFYDPQTHLLTWALRLRNSHGGESVNYNSRILGRGGVLSVNMVIAPQFLQQELPKYRDIIRVTSFQPGQKYSEWRPGDKIATYGLTALVTGGTVAVLAKTGLLAKFGKFLIYIGAAVVAVVGGFLKKLFGRKSAA